MLIRYAAPDSYSLCWNTFDPSTNTPGAESTMVSLSSSDAPFLSVLPV
jgi:hypothetical protein